MKLTISDGETEWKVEAINALDPDFNRKYFEQMMLTGHAYIYDSHAPTQEAANES